MLLPLGQTKSEAVPAWLKPVVLAVFAVIALACPEEIPVLAVLAVMALAWPEVMPVFAVLAVIADAWPEVIPVLAVFAATAELLATSVSKSEIVDAVSPVISAPSPQIQAALKAVVAQIIEPQ